MNKTNCTCGCTETTTVVVGFLTGYSPETIDVEYADVEVCTDCGSTVHSPYDPDVDTIDELPF
jgi:hypothetical protein